jgi:hypothetical protein
MNLAGARLKVHATQDFDLAKAFSYSIQFQHFTLLNGRDLTPPPY